MGYLGLCINRLIDSKLFSISFSGQWVFDACPLSLWCTDQNHNNTSYDSPPPPPRTGDEVSKSQGRERDHNKLIINRKWLHYGLKDGRECSLVTALSQIYAFLQGLGRAGSPQQTPASPATASAQGQHSGYSWGGGGIWGSLRKGPEGCGFLGVAQ